MTVLDEVCFWSADIVPLLTTLETFIYRVKNFFKKGKAFYLQIVTMAMAVSGVAGMGLGMCIMSLIKRKKES